MLTDSNESWQAPHLSDHLYNNAADSTFYIFLEYISGGSICHMLSRFGKFDETVIRLYTMQILKGLHFLHSMRCMHRDIKGANILVEKNGTVKLADFGMAKQLLDGINCTRSFIGSPFWMAPEVVRQQPSHFPADIWSLGCTVIEMATARPPWYSENCNQVQAIWKIGSSTDALPDIPTYLSPSCREFILSCLQRDPTTRPSAEELLCHSFIQIPVGASCTQSKDIEDEFDVRLFPLKSKQRGEKVKHRRVRSEGGDRSVLCQVDQM